MTFPAGTTPAKPVQANLLLFVNRIGVAGAMEVQTVVALRSETAPTAGTTHVPSGVGSGITVPLTQAGWFINVDVALQVG